MHRTEGADYVLESGKRRFTDQNLPSEPGTVDTAEFNNAVQEEIAYIIEQYGGDCDITAAADRAAGWHALHDTIFSDGNITTDAIDNISVAKLSIGTLSIVSGTNTWEQAAAGLIYRQDINPALYAITTVTYEGIYTRTVDGYVDEQIKLTVDGINCLLDDAAGSPLFETTYGPRGIQYAEGPGNVSAFESAHVRKAVFDLASAVWTLDSGNLYYYGADLDSSGIPDTSDVYSIFAKVSYSSGGYERLHPVSARFSSSGGFIELIAIEIMATTTPDNGCQLIIEYDASDVA